MNKAEYKNTSYSLWPKLITAFILLIISPAILNSHPYIPSGFNLKGYFHNYHVLPEWMIYKRKIEDLPRAPFKNLKRGIITYPSRSRKEIIRDFNRNGILMKLAVYKPSKFLKFETYCFTTNGQIDNIYEYGYEEKGFFYHYEFDENKRLISVWTDKDEKGKRIEYPNNFECVEYPGKKGDLIRRIKWNKEGIILSCEADNHLGEGYTYKYDTKSRIAYSIHFSNYDTTSIDSSFYNENLNLLCHKVFYKDTNKTGKRELYSSNKDEYVYGSDGRLRKEYNYNAAGQLERKHIYEHNKTPDYDEFIETIYFLLSKTVSKHTERYNTHNYLLWRSDWTNTKEKITEEYERYRYLDTLLIEQEVRNRYESYSNKYKYDKYGNRIEAITFDNKGKIIESDHTIKKKEVTKDQFGRVVSIREYENSSVTMACVFEYYDDTDRNTLYTYWYIILGAAGISCIIAFSFYLLRKRKSL